MSGRVPGWPALAPLVRRPDLWPTALRLVPPGWWRRWPPLPLPPQEYVSFRNETMYGSGAEVDGADLVRYLEWSRRLRSDAVSSRRARSRRR